MYIRKSFKRMMGMKQNTWKFVSMCFVSSYIYFMSAIIMLVFMQEHEITITALRGALELARMPQAVLIICAIGSVIIEEQSLKREK